MGVELERAQTRGTAQLTWAELTAEAWVLLSAKEQTRAVRAANGKLHTPLCRRCCGLLRNELERQQLMTAPQF